MYAFARTTRFNNICKIKPSLNVLGFFGVRWGRERRLGKYYYQTYEYKPVVVCSYIYKLNIIKPSGINGLQAFATRWSCVISCVTQSHVSYVMYDMCVGITSFAPRHLSIIIRGSVELCAKTQTNPLYIRFANISNAFLCQYIEVYDFCTISSIYWFLVLGPSRRAACFVCWWITILNQRFNGFRLVINVYIWLSLLVKLCLLCVTAGWVIPNSIVNKIFVNLNEL